MTIGQYFKYKKEKSVKKWIGFFFIIFFVAVSFKYIPVMSDVLAAAVSHGVAVNNEIPTETGEKGTKDNPFVILEIVPYEGYAEIGYSIKGCEPVDMDKLIYDGLMPTATSTGLLTDGGWSVRYRFSDEKGIPTSWTVETVEKTLYGYYERVAENTGNFIQTTNATTGAIEYKKGATNSGNLIWQTDFAMTVGDVETNKALSTIGERVYTSRTDNNCKKGNAYAYTNHNYFLKNVLGITDKEKIKNYHVVVKTIEPNELNAHLEWIDRADLISISPKKHIAQLPQVWEKFNKAGKPAKSSPPSDFGTKDLTWEASLRIFNKVIVAKDYAGIIMDWTVYTNAPASTKKSVTCYQLGYDGIMTTNSMSGQQGNSNNVYKLAMMMRTMDPEVFHNLFLKKQDGLAVSPLVQEGLFLSQPTSDAKNYWTQSTFMPSQKDGTGAWITHWDALWNTMKLNANMGDNVSVAGRLYTYNGDCALTQNFISGTVANTKFTEDFIDFANNDTKPKNPATAIEFILEQQYQADNQKANLTILDIEPSKDFTMTAHRIQMMIPKYSGAITVKAMTSAEFIGTIEDLNSKYDMIYLGMNCGGFNTTSQYIAGANRIVPDYNDYGLDGKIYLHVGDLITVGSTYNVNWLATSNNSNYRLSGNDITTIKASALGSYVDAGYPILVDTYLYQTGTTLTKALVDPYSNIYSFVNSKKSKQNLIHSAATTADADVEKYILKQKPQLKITKVPTVYLGETTTGSIPDSGYINSSNPAYRKLHFEYTILNADNAARYKVNLYIDANADGRFSQSEINMSKTGISPNVSNTLIKPLSSDYFGVIPWKFEIVDESNLNILDQETGFSSVKRTDTQKEEIRILQINQTDGASNASTLNLQKNVEDNGLFATYTKDLNDYKVTFETISIQKFEERYDPTKGGTAFVNTTQEEKKRTDHLFENYNMLIFGFSDSFHNISNQYGALDNIKYYIENYKSVLFTHDNTSFYNSSATPNGTTPSGYNFNVGFRDILGMDRFGARIVGAHNDIPYSPTGSMYTQIHGYTYYAAKRMAATGQLMTYKGLESGNGSFLSKTVNKLNDGQITKYPYLIDDTFAVATTHSQYYQLNMEDPEIVVWYCLATGSDGNALYDLSPKDASNNYYIYNKENITYSGVGHSTVGSNPMEVKLFVNTMIAAYKTSLKNPSVEVTNKDAFSMGNNKYAFFINSDVDQDTVYQAGDIISVDFIPWDYNFLSQNLGVKAALADGTPLKIYNEDGTQVTSTYINKAGQPMIELHNGVTYTIQYDKSLFSTEAKRQIIFEIENEKGLSGSGDAQFVKRVLFNLD